MRNLTPNQVVSIIQELLDRPDILINAIQDENTDLDAEELFLIGYNALPIPDVMPPLLSLDFKKMRKAKGLTLRQVEEITGVSNPYLSQLETGKIKSPGYDVVKALYDLYSNEA